MLTDRPHGQATARPRAWARPRVRFSPRAIGALCAGAMSMALTGCFFEGGPGWSADRFTYQSTSWNPKTVSLIDTRTGETLWSVDVPVDQQLVVAFVQDGADNDDETMPDLMKWQIFDAGKLFGNLENRMPVPNRHARLLELALRPAPEMPGAILSNRGPAEPEEFFIPVEARVAPPPVDEDDPFAAPAEEDPVMDDPLDRPEPPQQEPVPIDLDEPSR